MALFRTGLYVKDHSVEKVQVASTPIASFNGNVTGLYIPELIAYITAKQSGSGTPAPDNIRPFIGVSECNVTRCGKNVWSYGDISGTQRKAITVDIKAGTYTISANVTSSDTDYDYNLMLFYYEDNTTESVYINRGTRQNVTFTLSKNVTSINFYASRGNNVSVGDTFSFTDIQLETGSSATSYEAYSADTYTIPLGDTYYGGSLDVTTGVLTVDTARILFNAATTFYQSGHAAYKEFDGAFISDSYGYGLCDSYNFGTWAETTADGVNSRFTIYKHTNWSKPRLAFSLDGKTLNQFMNSLSSEPIDLIYKLATPITVQLTATQIEQLLGTNNVWADTGDVEVKFYNVIR